MGAEVVGADFEKVSLEGARQEAERWGVTDKVRFCHYNGSPASIPDTDFDFIFTKSVLVLIPDLEPFLEDLSRKMRPGGELITVENSSSGAILYLLRRRFRTGSTKKAVYLRGVNETFLAAVNQSFHIEVQKEYFGIVTAIRARKS